MTPLEQFLESYGPEHVQKSVTTVSRYYTIYGALIRVSDHISDNRDSIIQIVEALNEETYIVSIRNSKMFLTYSFDDLKNFITTYIHIWRMEHFSQKAKEQDSIDLTEVVPEAKPEVVQVQDHPSTPEPAEEEEYDEDTEFVYDTDVPINSPLRAANNEIWGVLVSRHIRPAYHTWDELSSQTKKACREIFKLNIGFETCMELLKQAITKHRAPKQILRFVTRYQNEHNC